MLTVQRVEADSKFFRSFFVVLGALTVVYASRHQQLAMELCLAGMLLALWRYIDQRFKSTQQAYWLAISFEAKKTGPPAATPRPDGLIHAGGVVYRRTPDGVKFMLIQASKDRLQWVLPKGHIEPGEDPRITAVREIKEETGHWARVDCWLKDGPLNMDDPSSPLVRWFLLELCEAPKCWRRENREFRWCSLPQATAKATSKEVKALLPEANDELNAARKRCG